VGNRTQATTAAVALATGRADEALLSTAKFNLDNTHIRAPTPGRTGVLLVTEGESRACELARLRSSIINQKVIPGIQRGSFRDTAPHFAHSARVWVGGRTGGEGDSNSGSEEC